MPDSENGYHKKNHLILAASRVSSMGKTVRGTCNRSVGQNSSDLSRGVNQGGLGGTVCLIVTKTMLTLPYIHLDFGSLQSLGNIDIARL